MRTNIPSFRLPVEVHEEEIGEPVPVEVAPGGARSHVLRKLVRPDERKVTEADPRCLRHVREAKRGVADAGCPVEPTGDPLGLGAGDVLLVAPQGTGQDPCRPGDDRDRARDRGPPEQPFPTRH